MDGYAVNGVTVVGASSNSTGNFAVIVGAGSYTTPGGGGAGNYSVIVGSNSVIRAGGQTMAGAIAIGGNVQVGNAAGVSGWNAIGIGLAANVGANFAIGIGSSVVISSGASNAIAIGGFANALSAQSIAIGNNATVGTNGANSIAIGRGVVVNVPETIQIGDSSLALSVPGPAYLNNVFITPLGGIAIKMINGRGLTCTAGAVVTPKAGNNNTFEYAPINSPAPIGITYESVADGAPCWVVISGRAEVYFQDSVVNVGDLARVMFSDDANATAGQAIAEPTPSSPFSTDKHWSEIGHVLSSRTGEGLANVVLHFN